MTFTRLWDYNYSPAHRVFEVKKCDVVLGIIENWEGRVEWKAFRGSGFNCKYLSAHRSRKSAVDGLSSQKHE